MNTLTEIETAIACLPAPELAELAAWWEQFHAHRDISPHVETWLKHARGAAKPGVTTDDVMKLMRGEE